MKRYATHGRSQIAGVRDTADLERFIETTGIKQPEEHQDVSDLEQQQDVVLDSSESDSSPLKEYQNYAAEQSRTIANTFTALGKTLVTKRKLQSKNAVKLS